MKLAHIDSGGDHWTFLSGYHAERTKDILKMLHCICQGGQGRPVWDKGHWIEKYDTFLTNRVENFNYVWDSILNIIQ